ncbi:aminoglycoside phosphotransferase family protein [Halosimplex litoreum]|uniref:Aminoglycoside phosphotransferase family protein n=1 Tax=Halosimplex litoreum TaxID=1198301 RepID=A0A7T3KUZ5_9EURY|nr:aminoglycoside phosphotransferase family protein [Halosimplex litoreum]QPV62443.1 aminoglycoside phosphotransferase family protein [Halosimplex litoreum]
MRLDADNAVAYLRESGVIPADASAAVEPLGGGVSNAVIRVSWADDAVVAKQPFPDLDVAEQWPADVARVHNEAAAARVYGDVATAVDDRGIHVPGVRFEDSAEHVIVLDAAPPSAETWKADLLAGEVDPEIATRLGAFLAAVHETAGGDPEVEAAFDRYEPFEQLRLDPYHRTVAERHPDLADRIEREVERIRTTRSTLVHGDYSPKNVLVDESTGDTRLWVLDFEVAHWGDPIFDLAFVCSHLCIKSVYRAEHGEQYVAAAESLLAAYRDAVGLPAERERHFLTELGLLLVARVDGKSPVEYVERESTAELIRTLGRRSLTGDVETFDEFASIRRAELETV